MTTTEHTQSDEKMLDRVRKLVALASHPNSDEERDAAMNMASALMVKHSIEEHHLGKGDVRREKVIQRVFAMEAPYSKAKSQGFYQVAEAVGFKAINYPGRRGKPDWSLCVVGFESDVEFFDYLLASLSVQMVRECSKAYDGSGKIFWTTFITYFCVTVARRLQVAREKAVSDVATSAPGTDLVLIDRSAEVRNQFHDLFPRVHQTTGVTIGGSGAGHGVASGKRADIGGTKLGGSSKAIGGS